MADQIAAFTVGASAAYAFGLSIGVAPPILAEHALTEWSRSKWGPEARKVLDELDSKWSYFNLKPKSSNRNFVLAQPECSRVRFVVYTSPWNREMRGVAKFGERGSGTSNDYICDGMIAAAADQILGMFAITMMLFPVVTANLDVRFNEGIPRGSELGILCKVEQGSDRIKKLIVTLRFYSLNPKDQKRDYAVVTGIFVNSILPNVIKSML